MNELVALALLAAFASGDFRLAGMISFFLLVSVIVESHTASGAQRSIESLLRLTPHTARRITNDGTQEEVDVVDLEVANLVSVRPGENFPADGVIAVGESAVNQASITGESVPVDKGVGDDVFAGTQNLSGGLTIRVSRVGKDTTLGKVKEMILSAERNKTPVVRMIDHYAGYYTPSILMIAAVTWWLSPGHDLSRVITLLVIACPCAIILSTPTAIIAAIAAAARLGILIKNVSHLELASKIRTFVFDKTGTLTEGVLSVARLNPTDGVEAAELLLIAASAESCSNHPTAKSLQKLALDVGLKTTAPLEFSELHGKGVSAIIEGRKCLVGRSAWMESCGIKPVAEDGSVEGMSVVHVSRDGEALGWIGFTDKLRDGAEQAIKELKRLGVKHCAMVSGDRASVVQNAAIKLKLDEFRANCLPEDKVVFVEEAKKRSIVAVVGDGINDAPALAAGSLGIAMGAIGSDIAVNSASIALMTNDLKRIPLLLELSKKMNAIIAQNLFFGLFFVVGGIVLSVFGYLSPLLAAILHSLSSIIIIFNSARLVRVGENVLVPANGLDLERSRRRGEGIQ